jgi:hypothetical protein
MIPFPILIGPLFRFVGPSNLVLYISYGSLWKHWEWGADKFMP